MQRIKLLISYDGGNFSGWQKQKAKRTVQGEIEKALSKIFGKEISVTGSSRTDAGVHALGQVAHFDLSQPFPIQNLAKALNAILPEDVKILKAQKAKSTFNARFDVTKKTYVYAVTSQQNPIFRGYCAQYTYNIDDSLVKQCLDLIKGKHNFKGFCASTAQVKNFEREIFEASFKRKKNHLEFSFTGNGFLQHMVRILVGTALDAGRGFLSIDSVKQALETGNRSMAGKTMPACGLYLKKIYF